jgi:hypothetical protein
VESLGTHREPPRRRARRSTSIGPSCYQPGTSGQTPLCDSGACQGDLLMLKKPGKMQLTKETLRHLSAEDMRQIVGDGTDTRFKTCTCGPTGVCSISCTG